MPDHEIRRIGRGDSVVEPANLPVGTANTNVDHPQQYITVLLESRLWMVVNHFNRPVTWKYRDSPHKNLLNSVPSFVLQIASRQARDFSQEVCSRGILRRVQNPNT